MIGLLAILAAAAAVWWGGLLISPGLRRLLHFVYSTGTPPESLNGGFSGDDVVREYAGDPADGEWPAVTVIVPGRNEGHLLEKTLGSLCAMDYPRFRVIFVDDQSSDNTAEVCARLSAAFPHLTILCNTESPRDGWVGKTWAVHQAEKFMHEGEYLLFSDADLEFHPQCLKQMIRLARHRRTDIASLLPGMYCRTIGEVLGLLSAMVIINCRLTLYACNNPKDPRTLVAGGFLLVKREVYHRLGGHAAVRGQVVEDVALGMRAKALGYRVFTAITHDLYRARMYEGWGDTFRGLKKNAYAGANYRLGFAAVIAGFLLFFGMLPAVYAAAGGWLAIAAPSGLHGAVAAVGVAALVCQMLAGLRTARFAGLPAWVIVLLPASFGFYLAVLLGSMADYYRGGNTWAGRKMAPAQTLADAGKVEVEGAP